MCSLIATFAAKQTAYVFNTCIDFLASEDEFENVPNITGFSQ